MAVYFTAKGLLFYCIVLIGIISLSFQEYLFPCHKLATSIMYKQTYQVLMRTPGRAFMLQLEK